MVFRIMLFCLFALSHSALAANLTANWSPFFGTSNSDRIIGTSGNNVIYGAASVTDPNDKADTIYGNQGNDTIYGNGGEDWIYGGQGNDTIYGGADRDYIYGNNGDDTIYGNKGNNHITGGAGKDIMYSGPESDIFIFAETISREFIPYSGWASPTIRYKYTINIDTVYGARMDRIIGFDANDVIDLSRIDADKTTYAQKLGCCHRVEPFKYTLGSNPGPGEVGAIRSNGSTVLTARVRNGDPFQIMLEGYTGPLTSADFARTQ